MSRPAGEGLTDEERYEQGMTVRREVLSDAHVDRAIAGTTELTADFQDFITRVAWGDIWSRPGLDRRSRSVAVITSLIAHGHHEELAMRKAVFAAGTPAYSPPCRITSRISSTVSPLRSAARRCIASSSW